MANRENKKAKPSRLDQFGEKMRGGKITEEDAPVTSNKEKRKWMKK